PGEAMPRTAKPKAVKRPPPTATRSNPPAVGTKPALLTGGNPQIAKAEGDAPVQAYIAAMPGWKCDVGRRLDALILRTSPPCARQSNGTRPSMAWRAGAGSSTFIASPGTSR